MALRPHPLQKLCHVPKTSGRSSLLLAAAGPTIFVFTAVNGSLLNHVPPVVETDPEKGLDEDEFAAVQNAAKRRKLDHPALSRDESEDSVEIVAERRKGERRKPKVENSKLPNVSHLVATSDGRHIIAVTTEDKSINTYSLMDSGQLTLISQRSMPKRLCSIALTPDDQTIIAADKFGDVYSLPLHPSDDYITSKPIREAVNGDFQASATELTVHTKGNLEALRQQREQKQRNARKEGPDFELKLLLGHVSLLTDVTIASAEISGKPRQFILTADRDEHVRVSRYPQAHVIHGYCLGFREFVSRICVIPWKPQLLVAGSGEPSLKVFDWKGGKLVSQVTFDGELGEVLQMAMKGSDSERHVAKLAVAGIWPVPLAQSHGYGSQNDGILLVALEGLPTLLSFQIKEDGQLLFHQAIALDGNVLDVAINVDEKVMAIVSVDRIHVPGSMIRQRTEPTHSDAITVMELESTSLRWTFLNQSFSLLPEYLQDVPPESQEQAARSSRARGEYSALGEFLYGLENLRKKRGIPGEEVDESLEAVEELAAEEAQ